MKDSSQPNNNHNEWYDLNIGSYKGLAELVATSLKSALEAQGISYVNIPFRHKEKKSFLKKLENKNYDPIQMTDLAGIRVITLIESDVNKVGNIIKSMFNIHDEDSINKSENLGEDKVGYRSVHYVCDIGSTRANLHEFTRYKGLCFEIQVRTALEHAWAEIEHDRGYKLSGKLPTHLNRRFRLLSGLLESADMEFNRLTVEIAEYAEQIKENITAHDSLDTEITAIGVKTLIDQKYKDFLAAPFKSKELVISESIENEILGFGVDSLKSLDILIQEFVSSLNKNEVNGDYRALIRHSLMFNDIDKYFTQSWDKSKWMRVKKGHYNIILKKYPKDKVDSLFEEKGITII